MSMPSLAGRPATPPVAPTPELLVARLRGRAAGLFWSALLLIAVAGAVGYFFDNLPIAIPNADLWLLVAAGLIVLIGVIVPVVVWASRTYTITSRRVIVKRGLLSRHQSELPHVRGYAISLHRGILQRLAGTGTITLRDGLSAPLVLKNIPHAVLVHEVLADQVEMSQIQAHRDSQGFSFGHAL